MQPQGFWYNARMRKNRFIGQDRCYHLVSRLAHRAFFLDDEEKDRAVALMRRVEEFSGVVVLAYAFMSNHFHIFVYVPKAEEIDEAEKGDCHAGRGAASFRSKADPQLDIPEKVGIGLARGSEKVAKRILELLADGPMRPSALREAVGIRSRVHFSRCYMTPLVEKGLVARTNPDKPMSPRQEYKLA